MRSALKLAAIAVATLLLTVTGYVGKLVATNNLHVVSEGKLYRSARPSASDIAQIHEQHGIRTIVNLLGANPGKPWYDEEKAAAEKAGIELIDYRLSDKRDLKPGQLDEIIALLRRAKGPILVHCYRGADRSALVSAIYLAAVEGSTESLAENQFMPRYGHVPLWFLPAYAMDRSFEAAKPQLGFGAS